MNLIWDWGFRNAVADRNISRAGTTGCHHGFVGRVPGIELSHDKAVVLENLDKVHRQARRILGLGDRKFITVRQVHGDRIARVDSVPATDRCFEGCDGLITNQRECLPWEFT